MAIRTFSWPSSSVSIPGVATEATQLNVLAKLQQIDVNTYGSATEATQQLVLAELQGINIDTNNLATESTLSNIDTKTPALVSGRVPVDGSGVTQPVSAASLPLPTGASTSAAQTDGSQKSQIVDAGGDSVDVVQLGTAVTSTNKGLVTNSVIHGLSTGGGGVFVDVKVTPSGALVTDTTISGTIAATQSGTWNINNVSGTISLPTGAATEATLSSIDTKIPSNLTVTSTRLLVDGSGVTQPISAASLPLPSGAATETTLSSLASQTTRLGPVDQLDTPLIDTSGTNIPASASLPLEVVATLASNVRKVISVEDIGEFIGVYTGSSGSEILHCILPLGGGEVEVNLTAGTRISLRNMKNAAISSGSIAINFLG